jgi:hypothetical protein
LPAQNGFAVHVAGEQLVDVADRKHIRVDEQRSTGEAEQLWHVPAEGSE